MDRPACELADIVRVHGEQFLKDFGHLLGPGHRSVLFALMNCRTAVLGGHVDACDHCDHRSISYNSCRNRHCPKCQGSARDKWLAARSAELLPVPYFHVVFTLPQQLAPLALQNQRVVYSILFRSVAETLIEVAADPRHLGAEIGFLAVLHTWGQTLQHHPHVHCVIPGGGLTPAGVRWISARNRFLFPVRILSRVFRGKFLSRLRTAFRRGQLRFHGRLSALAGKAGFGKLLDQAYRLEWVVYAKPPFGGPEQVLRYLARYTHRVAISNQRILAIADGEVTFRWKDYAHANRKKKMTLPACEFLRRFFLHVLPPRFVRIRHFGFMANRWRKARLTICRALLVPRSTAASVNCTGSPSGEAKLPLCPVCRAGRMHIVERIPSRLGKSSMIDSS